MNGGAAEVSKRGGQPSLFGADDWGAEVPEAATPGDELRRLGARLPARVRLGTSSWSFPGWKGLVFAGNERTLKTTVLARHGLGAYAAHPVLRTVGIDRTFYAPIGAEEFAKYAAVVPEGFRFLVKAYQGVTRPSEGGSEDLPGTAGAAVNEHFLDPGYAIERVIAPALQGLGRKLGPLVFQFSPLGRHEMDALGGAGGFIDRLAGFLAQLPPLHPPDARGAAADQRTAGYAVEVRNRELLTPPWVTRYAAVLAAFRASHCYNVHPTVPTPAEQREMIPSSAQPLVVVRWMLHAGVSYTGAKERYAPFDRIVEPDTGNREAIARLAAEATELQPVFVIVNNKAEGCAPLSAIELAKRILERGPRV